MAELQAEVNESFRDSVQHPGAVPPEGGGSCAGSKRAHAPLAPEKV